MSRFSSTLTNAFLYLLAGLFCAGISRAEESRTVTSADGKIRFTFHSNSPVRHAVKSNTSTVQAATTVTSPATCCVPRPPLDAVIIGVRPDPLLAYSHIWPGGLTSYIPASERGYVLDMLRSAAYQMVMNSTAIPVQSFVPGNTGEEVVPAPAEIEVVPPPVDARPVRVTSEAIAVRTQGTAQDDSILLRVFAFNALGERIAINGTVEAELIARRQRVVPVTDGFVTSQYGSPKRLASWTENLNSANSNTVLLTLPQPLPADDERVAGAGALHLKIQIPGHGTFEDWTEPVALRTPSPLRDVISLQTGSRFLQDERTVSGRQISGLRRQRLTSFRPDGGFFTIEP
ncbi:hypothetical protein [Calycomorphotria hydatis]|uniref:Bacterial type II and III secretion system protein n=1 Tax=Calycomorphotria hydatis TaxID=2528027 RepID=A0A517T8G9_9PLAN|nr:hypothetical protein [Calycomorphotria hydatis]QDT64667.1 hypothetical protein V22_19070 [Calycomorphotria hydatis]